MVKEIETMTDRELLLELVAAGRRAEKRRRVRLWVYLAVAAALLALCLIYVPRLVCVVRQFNDTMGQLRAVTDQAQDFFRGIGDIGYDKLRETVDQVDAVTAEIQTVMDRLQAAGLDKLEQSLEQLNETLGRLRAFFGG